MLPEMLDLAWVQILELKIAFFFAGIKRTLKNRGTLVLQFTSASYERLLGPKTPSNLSLGPSPQKVIWPEESRRGYLGCGAQPLGARKGEASNNSGVGLYQQVSGQV